jgi:hypothetical protein
MDVLDLLVGKHMLIMTDMKVEVELEIKEVKQNNHSQDLEPSTQANDWWPATRDWTTFTVTFTNGAIKKFDSINHIKVI